MALQLAAKGIPDREPRPQRLKPNSKQGSYRSGKPLRHPKATAAPFFPQAVKPCPDTMAEFSRSALLHRHLEAHRLDSRRRGNNGGGPRIRAGRVLRSEEHTSELQSRQYLVCR